MIRDINERELVAAGALDLPNPHLGDLRTIHPIFQSARFRNITDVEYAALRPSLRVCSAYLAESFDLQIFWHTIIFGRRHDVPNFPGWQFVTRPYPAFTEQNYHHFDELLMRVAAMFDFRFAPVNATFATDPWAETRAWDRRAVDPTFVTPPAINGFPSIITFSPIFLESAVAAQKYLASVPAGATPHPKMVCLILRQQWFFAVTAVHELAHAVNNAQMAHIREAEPFFGGQRRAEVGYAWEQFVHRGQVSQIHTSRASDCGLSFAAWPPGVERVEYIGPKAPNTGMGWNRRASRTFPSSPVLGCVVASWVEADEKDCL